MEGLAAAAVAVAIVLGLALLLGFLVFCLVRIATAGEVRFLPKWAWAVAVVCVNPLGGAAYLLTQQARPARPASKACRPLDDVLTTAMSVGHFHNDRRGCPWRAVPA